MDRPPVIDGSWLPPGALLRRPWRLRPFCVTHQAMPS